MTQIGSTRFWLEMLGPVKPGQVLLFRFDRATVDEDSLVNHIRDFEKALATAPLLEDVLVLWVDNSFSVELLDDARMLELGWVRAPEPTSKIEPVGEYKTT